MGLLTWKRGEPFLNGNPVDTLKITPKSMSFANLDAVDISKEEDLCLNKFWDAFQNSGRRTDYRYCFHNELHRNTAIYLDLLGEIKIMKSTADVMRVLTAINESRRRLDISESQQETLLNKLADRQIELQGEYGMNYTEIYLAKKRALNPVHAHEKLIKNVIFNDPATIVVWDDGTKTVVKTQNGEPYDKEKGLAMAIAKKALGNEGYYYNAFAKWIKKDEEAKG